MAIDSTTNAGIDVQGIVSRLMAVERRPLQAIQNDAKKVDTKISAYGKLQSALATFRDAAALLATGSSWRQVKSSTSDPSAIEVVAKAGANPSQYTVDVLALAKTHTMHSAGFAGADSVIGGGTLKVQMGSFSGGNFVADSSRPQQSIAIAAGSTLAQIRDAINASDAGIHASIVTDGAQVRLLLNGSEPGSNQAFNVTVNDLDNSHTNGSGLSQLTHSRLTQVQAPSDAEYRINGLLLKSSGNRIENAVDGIDLVLKKTTSSSVTIDISSDREALKANAQKFIEQYNALNALIAEQTRFDETSKAAGPLQGDRSAIGVQQQIRQTLTAAVSGSDLARLSDAGIRVQRDGSLKLDEKAFDAAASDPARLERLLAFTSASATPAEKGLAVRMREVADQLLGANGAIATATDSWRARRRSLDQRQDALNNRLAEIEKRLTRQYSQLDAQLGSMGQISVALQAQLANLKA
ncbi:MAG TPA: flagellar filament capping protein FliD [Burkholderiaceae bacterium]|jgi:flagellar hook-associated protein 2|nr:flagellar filament capping protein FliD [Burkholderiaceae bacterium]